MATTPHIIKVRRIAVVVIFFFANVCITLSRFNWESHLSIAKFRVENAVRQPFSGVFGAAKPVCRLALLARRGAWIGGMLIFSV